MAIVCVVPSIKKFCDDDMSASFWNEVVGKQMGFLTEATRIHESLASEYGLITVGCLKQPWVTLAMIETAVVKATQSETHPEGRRGWMRSIQHLLQHQFATMAPGAPVSAALALSAGGVRLPSYAPKDNIKLGDKLKLEGTLDAIQLPSVLDTMEYETENPFVADLSANDTKEISKHVFLQRALADNYVSGDLEVEKKYAKLLKAKYLGKPAFSGDWKKILKGRAAMGRRSSASVLSLILLTSPCCTLLTALCCHLPPHRRSIRRVSNTRLTRPTLTRQLATARSTNFFWARSQLSHRSPSTSATTRRTRSRGRSLPRLARSRLEPSCWLLCKLQSHRLRLLLRLASCLLQKKLLTL